MSSVLITGASTGFGRLASEVLAERGYTVYATMRDIAGRNAPNYDQLRSIPGVQVLELDVTDDSSVERAVQQAGPLDVVINNAGSPAIGVTEAYTAAEFQRLFDINVCGSVRVNRAVLPEMRRQGRGLLIHVSSAAGRISVPYMAPYSASKFALEALAEAYRWELQPFNIDSVIVEPGIFKTPIFDKGFPPADRSRIAEYGSSNYSERVTDTFDQAVSAPDAPDPQEVVNAFVTLIETPTGKRPFRTVVGSGVRPLLESFNKESAKVTSALNRIFNLPELTPPRID